MHQLLFGSKYKRKSNYLYIYICTRTLHSWQARIGANAAPMQITRYDHESHRQQFQLLPKLSNTEQFNHNRSFTSIAGGPPSSSSNRPSWRPKRPGGVVWQLALPGGNASSWSVCSALCCKHRMCEINSARSSSGSCCCPSSSTQTNPWERRSNPGTESSGGWVWDEERAKPRLPLFLTAATAANPTKKKNNVMPSPKTNTWKSHNCKQMLRRWMFRVPSSVFSNVFWRLYEPDASLGMFSRLFWNISMPGDSDDLILRNIKNMFSKII